MFLVSACLAGVKCKHNGGDNLHEPLLELVQKGKALLICPEQLGGLPTPREPAEIQGGSGEDVLAGKAKILTKTGQDFTANFIKGAEESLKIGQLVKAKGAILKEGSPSCGSGYIYDGSFQKSKKNGAGITAALLKDQGYEIYSELDSQLADILRKEVEKG